MLKRTVLFASLVLAWPVSAYADDNEPSTRVYHGHTYYKHCRHSSGTTGLVAGGVGGAVVGAAAGGGIIAPIIGAAAGALGGRAIDRSVTAKRRCYYSRGG